MIGSVLCAVHTCAPTRHALFSAMIAIICYACNLKLGMSPYIPSSMSTSKRPLQEGNTALHVIVGKTEMQGRHKEYLKLAVLLIESRADMTVQNKVSVIHSPLAYRLHCLECYTQSPSLQAPLPGLCVHCLQWVLCTPTCHLWAERESAASSCYRQLQCGIPRPCG